MVHKKYIEKNGKRYGPYYYESYRDSEGHVKKRYIVHPKKSIFETIKTSRVTPFALLFALFAITFIYFYITGNPFTGGVVSEILPVYSLGENLGGQIKFNLRAGEFIPADAVVTIRNGEQTKEILLSELIVNQQKTSGDFYLENSELSGQGEGFGILGKKITYPEILFELAISEKDSSLIIPSENETTQQNETEINQTETTETNETEMNETIIDVSEPETNENETIPETPLETPPETETPAESEVPTETQEPISEEIIPEENSETTESSESTEEPSESSGESSTSPLTGEVISGESQIIQGSVKKEEDYTYSLTENTQAEIVSGSAKVQGVSIDDSYLQLTTKDNEVIVSADYEIVEEGFGEDYLGNYNFTLELDLSEFEINVSNPLIQLFVTYNNTTLLQAESTILIEGQENLTENLTLGNVSLIQEIPSQEINKNEQLELDLSMYFVNAVGYEFIAQNISAKISGNNLILIPDENYTGISLAKIIAYSQTESIESNQFEIIVSSSEVNITTNSSPIRLGQPVKWTTNILMDSPEIIKVNLPAEATNIIVKEKKKESSDEFLENPIVENETKINQTETAETKEINETLEEPIQEIVVEVPISETDVESSGIITGNAVVTFNLKKQSKINNWFKKFYSSITGRVIEEEEIIVPEIALDEITEVLEVELPGTAEEYVIEYETPAPVSFEQDLAKGKQVIVSGPDNLNYQNVIAFTTLNESLGLKNPSRLKIEWVESGGYEIPPLAVLDTDFNGIYDYVEWIVPHLSNQTFNIIVITKAEHLDENKTFVSDIFDEVRYQDDVWSEEIPENHYVRVTFERNLTSSRDITVFPKIVSGNPKIEIYEKDGTEIIAEFNNLNENELNKVYLTSLEGEQDSFDLKILEGSLIFDYITDPSSGVNVQRASEYIGQTYLNLTVMIDSVNTSNSLILHTTRCSTSGPHTLLWTSRFINSTAVELSRLSTGNTNPMYHEVEVIENDDFNVQRDNVSVGSSTASVDIDINPVNLSNSFIVLTCKISATTRGYEPRCFFTAEFVNSTRFNITRGTTGTAVTVGWQVVSWNGATVQRGIGAPSTSPTSVSIDSINTSKSFVISSQRANSTSSTALNTMSKAYFLNSTRLALYREGTVNNDATSSWFVISHPDIYAQHGTTSSSSTSGVNATLDNSVDMDTSFTMSGETANTSNTYYAAFWITRMLFDNSTIQTDKDYSSSYSYNSSWSVIQISRANPPTYSNVAHNNTNAGQATLFSAYWNDETALNPNGQYIFSTNNTGSWQNESAVNFTATPSWANVTKTLNSTGGIVVGYRWYAKDNAGNWNSTGINVLTTSIVDLTAPTYSNIVHNNTYREAPTLFSVLWDDETALNPNGQYIFSTNNTGSWQNDSNVNFTATPKWANVTKSLNSTTGAVIGYRWYAKDDAGNWNSTAIQTLTITSYTLTITSPTTASPEGTSEESREYAYFNFLQGASNITSGVNISNITIDGKVAPVANKTLQIRAGISNYAASTPEEISFTNNLTESSYPTLFSLGNDGVNMYSIQRISSTSTYPMDASGFWYEGFGMSGDRPANDYNHWLAMAGATDTLQNYSGFLIYCGDAFYGSSEGTVNMGVTFPNTNYAIVMNVRNSSACNVGGYVSKTVSSWSYILKNCAGTKTAGTFSWCAVSFGNKTISSKIIQAGYNTTTGGTEKVIKLNTPFSDANYVVVTTANTPGSNPACSVQVDALTTQNFTIRALDDDIFNSCDGREFNWIAVPTGEYNLTESDWEYTSSGWKVGMIVPSGIQNWNDLMIKATYQGSSANSTQEDALYLDNPLFVTRWNTSKTSTGSSNSTQVTLPLMEEGNYEFLVDWGDGSDPTGIGSYSDSDKTHNYATAGIYNITISAGYDMSEAHHPYHDGTIEGWVFNDTGDKWKILEVKSWGDLKLGNVGHYFHGCLNLNNISATDSLDLTNINDLSYAFAGTNLSSISGLNSWDLSQVTNLSGMFYSADNFNQDISEWNTSSVVDMNSMFGGAATFNQNISNWDTSQVTDMSGMFAYATSFNQSLAIWNTSQVNTTREMFSSATNFNQSLNNWNTSAVTDMSQMFWSAKNFNQPIGNWNTSAVTDMSYMFYGAINFNQNLTGWDTSQVTNMKSMFNWDIYAHAPEAYVFPSAENGMKFNGNVSNWNTSEVIDMNSMFAGAINFNQNLNNWNVSKVNDTSKMFYHAWAFNQSLSNWDVSSLNNSDSMFSNATSFDQNLSNWNVSNLMSASNMFANVTLSTPNYNSLLIGWASRSPNLKNSVPFHGGYSKYTIAANASRNGTLIGTHSWTISDGGMSSAPAYSNVGHSSTQAGASSTFSVLWTDDVALHPNGQYIFSTNNTGSWQNDSNVNFTATPKWANVTKTLSSTVGAVIGYRWYAKNNAGDWNSTSINTLTTVDAIAPTYSNIAHNSSNAGRATLFSAYWDDNLFLNPKGHYIFSTNNTGSWSNDTSILFSATPSWANVTKTLNTTGGKVIGYRWYANDSAGNWNSTGINTLTTVDVTFPTYSNIAHNNTQAGQATLFSAYWNDETALNPNGQYIFSTNNTGSWQNESAVNFTSTPSWANVTKTLNGTVGIAVGYRWYAKDNAGNWNSTSINVLTSSDIVAPTYSGIGHSSTQAGASSTFSITWNDETALNPNGQYIFSTNNSGSWQNDSAVNFTTTPNAINTIKTLTTTVGAVVGYRWYAKDNAQNWNSTGINTLTTVDTIVPTYSNIAHNSSNAGQATLFSAYWNDDIALNPNGQYIFSTNNTGSWQNDSAVNFTATPSWANLTKTLNSTAGTVVGYRWYAKDNAGNWNSTEINTLTTTLALTFSAVWNTSKTSTGSSNSTTINLPLESTGVYNFTVDWGDGNISTVTSYEDYDRNHTYSSEGEYTINITGAIQGFRFNNAGDRLKLIDIKSWGPLNLGNSGTYFYGCATMRITATDVLNLTGTTTLTSLFNGASNLTTVPSINDWNTSGVTLMSSAFNTATNFNQDLTGWDTSKVTSMGQMFRGAAAFNGNISNWNTSSLTGSTSMYYMFYGATNFNQNLSGWDLRNVTATRYMFYNAKNFNQPIGNWNTSVVTDMSYMFNGATNFNQPIGNWDTSNVTNMWSMFGSATKFNQSLANWNTSKVTNMNFMFMSATNFNQNISNWDTSKVTNMNSMFYGTTNFNQNISNWDTSNVTVMASMFYNAKNFNQSLANWNTSSVTDMNSMFYGTTNFNQNISNWDTSKVTNMYSMFSYSTNFNQPIGNWDTSNVTKMNWMFLGATNFNQNISNWNTSAVEDMSRMFESATNFNQNISGWNTSGVYNMNNTFNSATSFNQNLGSWNISNLSYASAMFSGVTLSTPNYNSLLIGWASQSPNLKNNVYFDGGNSKYTIAANASRNGTLIGTHSWTITDGGLTTLPDITFVNPTYNNTLSYSTPYILTNVTASTSIGSIDMIRTFLYNSSGLVVQNNSSTSPFYWNISGLGEGIYYLNATVNTSEGTENSTETRTITLDLTAPTYSGIGHTSTQAGASSIFSVYWNDSLALNPNGQYIFSTNNSGSWVNDSAVNFTTTPSWANVSKTLSSNLGAVIGYRWYASDNAGNWNSTSVSTLTITDAIAPTYSNIAHNSSNAGRTTLFSVYWNDNLALNPNGRYIFSTNNTGTWVNDSSIAFSTTPSWANVSKTLNTTFGAVIGYRWYANDTAGNWNATDIQTLTTVPEGTIFSSVWNTSKTSTGSTNSNQIGLPLESTGTYNFVVNWGDGLSNTITAWNQAEVNHTYSSEGNYTINITGTIQGWKFNNTGDRLKILDIKSFGPLNLGNSGSYFYNCSNMVITATDVLNLTGTTTMYYAFASASSLTTVPSMNDWDTSFVTDMRSVFTKATNFNQNISNWDTSRVIYMSAMFSQASSFNQPIGNWDTSNVTTFSDLFNQAISFNQSLEKWNTSKVNNMWAVFATATNFNGNISDWDTSKVTTMGAMFYLASNFNQPIGNWNTSKVNTMASMFYGATNFNQSLADWDTHNVNNLQYTFRGATNFNQNISNWNTSNVTTMEGMFWSATNFNQNLSNWDTSKVTTIMSMFSSATSFNGNVSNWNISKIEDLDNVFYNTPFNQPLNNWDTSNVTSMYRTFGWATSFNQDLSNWNTSKVIDMSYMFYTSTNFNQPIGNWDISKVNDTRNMFASATSFNQNLSNWNVSSLLNATDMFNGVTLSTQNYDSLLIGWASQSPNLKNSVAFHGGSSKYTIAANASRNGTLIGTHSWTITDGGFVGPPNITFVNPTYNNTLSYSTPYILTNVTASTSIGSIDMIRTFLYNSSGLVVQNNSSTSPFYWNISGLGEGIYYLNATVNTSEGTENSTETRTITLDLTPPISYSLVHNSSSAGQATKFSVYWSDNLALQPNGQYIFSTNNSGSWANDSTLNFTTNPASISIVKTLNSTAGVAVGYRWYAKDNAGNWNATEIGILETLERTAPTIDFVSPTPNNLDVLGVDNVYVNFTSSDVGRGDGNISTFTDWDNSLVSWWRMGDDLEELTLNGGAETGTTANWTGFSGVTSSDSYSGDYAFFRTGATTAYGSLISINTSKIYNFSGMFKSNGTGGLSKLYFGFMTYDENQTEIIARNVNAIAGTETTLYSDLQSTDKIVKVVNGANWYVLYHGCVAFNIDDSGNYNDLPNRNLSTSNITRVENMGDYWEIEFNTNLGVNASAGTKVRMHQSGGYQYDGAAGVSIPTDWTNRNALMVGEALRSTVNNQWRKGTKYVRIVMLLNYAQSTDYSTLVDDLSLTVLDPSVDYMGRNNGTVYGNITTSDFGAIGRSAQFDGDGDYIITPVDLNGSQNLTYSVWFNWNGGTGGNGLTTLFGNNINSYNILRLNSGNNLTARFSCYWDSTSGTQYDVNYPISKDRWYLATIVKTPGKLSFYLDNSLEWEPSVSDSDITDIVLGRQFGVTRDWFGSLDDVMIFNRSLSAAEVAGLYANTSSRYLGINYTGLEDRNYTFQSYSQDTSGNVNLTEKRTVTISTNTAPNDPVVTLNSTDGSNKTLQDLNCKATITDPEANAMNVSVRWWKNNTLNLTQTFNNSYANGTLFNATLGNGNTTKGDVWKCEMRLYDGELYSNWTNSSNLTILNSLPTVTLSSPPNGNVTTNRRPTFSWTGADDDGDSLTYQLGIILDASSTCSDPDRNITGIASTSHTLTQDLRCLIDNGDFYLWTVAANDGVGYGAWPSQRNISIMSLIEINLTNRAINFGTMAQFEVNDTTDDNPLPFKLQNIGNAFVNITVEGSSLWQSATNPTEYLKYKAANRTNASSFNFASSITGFTMLPLEGNPEMCIAELNYTNGNDIADIDIYVEVPPNEYASANRHANITFTASLAE